MNQTDTKRLFDLAQDMADIFQNRLGLDAFFRVFEEDTTLRTLEKGDDFVRIQTSWKDFLSLSQRFQSDFLPNNFSFRTESSEENTGEKANVLRGGVLKNKTANDFETAQNTSENAFLLRGVSKKNAPIDFEIKEKSTQNAPFLSNDSWSKNATDDFETAQNTNENAFLLRGVSKKDTAIDFETKEKLTQNTPFLTDNSGLKSATSDFENSEKSLQNANILRGPFFDKNFEKESATASSQKANSFENDENTTDTEQKTNENISIWEKPLGNFLCFSGLSETHFEAHPFSQKTEEYGAMDRIGNSPFFEKEKKTTASNTQTDWAKQTEYPALYENSYTTDKHEEPYFTKETDDFLQKDDQIDDDITARTDELLEALTQRIVQDFQRFYP